MRILQIFCVALVTYGQASSTTPGVTVKVRDASDVANRTFTLGEIAEVTGADKALVAEVSAVEVGTSPLAGLSRTLLKGDVETRLRFNHVDMKRVSIVWPGTVRVTRAGSEIPANEIVEVARKAIAEARKEINDDAVVAPAQLPIKWLVPPGKREYEAGRVRGQLEGGQASVEVRILVDGRPVKTVEVPFNIKRMTTVLLAKRRIPVHTVLAADDLTTGQVELTPTTADAIVDAAAVIGKRTTRQVEQGKPITENLVELPPAVVPGTQVTLEIVVGSVRISTTGVARSSGAVGSLVRVYATDTKKEVTGLVLDSKTVRAEEK